MFARAASRRAALEHRATLNCAPTSSSNDFNRISSGCTLPPGSAASFLAGASGSRTGGLAYDEFRINGNLVAFGARLARIRNEKLDNRAANLLARNVHGGQGW